MCFGNAVIFKEILLRRFFISQMVNLGNCRWGAGLFFGEEI